MTSVQSLQLDMFKTIAMFCLLLASTQAQSLYTYSFNTLNGLAPTQYPLGYMLSGLTLQVNLTTSGTALATFFQNIIVTAASTTPITNVVCATSSIALPGCTATDNFCIKECVLVESAIYTLELSSAANSPPMGDSPSSDAATPNQMQTFLVDISYWLTSSGGPSVAGTAVTIKNSLTQTFRDREAKLIYIKANQMMGFFLYPVPAATLTTPDLTNIFLQLFRVASTQDAGNTYVLDAAGPPVDYLTAATHFTQTYDSGTQTLTYIHDGTHTVLAPGFYVISLRYGIANTPFVRLRFNSDSYSCPHKANYPDYHNNFQPCIGSASQPSDSGFPCASFDGANGVCIDCFAGFLLVNGSCKFNDTCPDRQFFKFGKCFNVSSNCATYDAFTGFCLTCNLNDSSIINGVCTPKPVICGNRQYQKDRVCLDVSILCGNFDSTGACTSCVNDYELKNGTCSLIVISCGVNQYQVNRTCIYIPKECVIFDQTNRVCNKCALGYWPSNFGVCLKIICPPRQFPSGFGMFCFSVAPSCGTYDELTGDCLSCREQDTKIVNGKCKKITSPLAGCKERERLGFGPCVDAQLNCQTFNLQNGDCIKCVNGWFPDFTGRCRLSNRVCQADEINILGYCIQKTPNCETFDNLGLCLRCSSNYRNIFGQCYYFQSCAANQYQNEYGACLDITSGCTIFNPSTGVCLTCTDGTSAINGICCPTGQIAFKGQCIDDITYKSVRNSAEGSSVPTCLAYHPTLGNCLQCNNDFKPDPLNPNICI